MDWKKNRGRKNKKKKLENRYNLFIFGWVERAMKYQEKKKWYLTELSHKKRINSYYSWHY